MPQNNRAYEIWALAIDNNIEDGYDDGLFGTFESLSVAQWFFDHYPFVYTPNTRITLEYVEYDDEGNGSCVDVLDEKELVKN